MQRLKAVIEQYPRWVDLMAYIERIETYATTDFSLALENAKALLESVGKEICSLKNVPLTNTVSFDGILKKAFTAIGHSGGSMVTQISRSLANIGQQMGELRNQIGTASHGRPLEEIRERNNRIGDLTKDLLIETTVIVASFIIRTFEAENPAQTVSSQREEGVKKDPRFDDYWDEVYGEFAMGEYSYPASDVLYSIDPKAYASEQKAFIDFMDN